LIDKLAKSEGSTIPTGAETKTESTKKKQEPDRDNSKKMCAAKLTGDRPCKSKALNNCNYCWHHAPLDPNSLYVWCNYIDPKNNKKCNIPVLKSKPLPYCGYHIKSAEESQSNIKPKKQKEEEPPVNDADLAQPNSPPTPSSKNQETSSSSPSSPPSPNPNLTNNTSKSPKNSATGYSPFRPSQTSPASISHLLSEPDELL